MTLKHQDVIWLAGQVFLFRDFMKESANHNLKVALKALPYGDLTPGEKATFEAAFNNPRLRAVAEKWWQIYDAERASGNIPQAGTYWENYVLHPNAGTKGNSTLIETGYQDIIWLAGQVFLFREFVKMAGKRSLEAIYASCPYGDLTEGEKATFKAAFNNARLREVVTEWWRTYDTERAAGNIPQAGTYWENYILEPEPGKRLSPVKIWNLRLSQV